MSGAGANGGGVEAAVKLSLSHDELGQLVVELPNGEVHAGVVLLRCFPFSAPTEHISFCTEQGRELFALPSLDMVDAATRQALEGELARREFIPLISRVVSVVPDSEPSTWTVETDRGPTEFVLPSEDHVRALGPHGALLCDANGVRYRVADLRALDAHSRKLLRVYL